MPTADELWERLCDPDVELTFDELADTPPFEFDRFLLMLADERNAP